jgi:hypothetical protein
MKIPTRALRNTWYDSDVRVGTLISVWSEEDNQVVKVAVTAGDMARLYRYLDREDKHRAHITASMAQADREYENRLREERQAEGARRLAAAREANTRILATIG